MEHKNIASLFIIFEYTLAYIKIKINNLEIKLNFNVLEILLIFEKLLIGGLFCFFRTVSIEQK